MSVIVDKRGRRSKTTKTLVNKLLISSSEADAIRAIGDKLDEQGATE